MTFALTNFKAYSIIPDSATKKRAHCVVEMTITRASSDVLIDLDSVTGTFWTAALANTTDGGAATKALASWTQALTYADRIISHSMYGSTSGLIFPYPLDYNADCSLVFPAGTAFEAAHTVTGKLRANSNWAQLTVPAVSAASKTTGAAASTVAPATIPAAYRPVADVYAMIRIKDNDVFIATPGMALVASAGTVTIYKDGVGTTPFTDNKLMGWSDFTVSWYLAPTNDQYAISNQGTFPVLSPRFTLPSGTAPATLKLTLVLALADGKTTLDFEF